MKVKIKVDDDAAGLLRAGGAALLLAGLYLVLENFPLFSSPTVDPGAGLMIIFGVGLLTGVHCIGMCSGFVMAYATGNEKDSGIQNHLVYNASRMVSYAAVGAAAGFIGSVFLLTTQVRGYLSLFAGAFMVVFGLGQFFPGLRRFTAIRTPNLTKYAKGRGPVVFGLLNGMMPCGPLQAMLIYSASTGSALAGGMTMLAFGLGTVPFMLGFGSVVSSVKQRTTRRIVELSALMVMALGLVTLGRGLSLSGYDIGVTGFFTGASALEGHSVSADGFQHVNMTVDRYGWDPDTFVVKRGVPVKWHIHVEELNYCNKGITMSRFGINRYFNRVGESLTLEFTPTESGVLPFTCWMGMLKGRFIVKDELDATQPAENEVESTAGNLVLKVRGMCCTGCAAYIERMVSAIRGVESAGVEFETGRAYIEYNSQEVAVETIVSRIKSTGKYDAEVI